MICVDIKDERKTKPQNSIMSRKNDRYIGADGEIYTLQSVSKRISRVTAIWPNRGGSRTLPLLLLPQWQQHSSASFTTPSDMTGDGSDETELIPTFLDVVVNIFLSRCDQGQEAYRDSMLIPDKYSRDLVPSLNFDFSVPYQSVDFLR